jgi:hypothetical protein
MQLKVTPLTHEGAKLPAQNCRLPRLAIAEARLAPDPAAWKPLNTASVPHPFSRLLRKRVGKRGADYRPEI